MAGFFCFKRNFYYIFFVKTIEQSIKKFEMNITDSKKEMILKTARELLVENGFAKTTLEDIANAVGMRKSSLYYYYDNKELLLRDVLIREEERFFELVYKDVESEKSLQDKILKMENAKFKYLAETSKMYMMAPNIYIEFKTLLYDYIIQVKQKELDILTRIIDEAIAKNEIKECDSKKVANLIITISEALRHREFYFATFSVNKEINFNKAVAEMEFAIKLIIKGLN